MVTLSAGTYTLAATANFNLPVKKTFTSSMFLSSGAGIRLSNIAASGIPEPSTWALALGGCSARWPADGAG